VDWEGPSLEIPAIQELAQHPQWVCWKAERRASRAKPTKVPYTTFGGHASSTARETWGTFADCYAACVKGTGEGVGFVFDAEDIYAGIDLDGSVSDGKVKPWAQKIIDDLASYTEFSPGGDGLHVIVRSKQGIEGRKTKRVEAYTWGRYFTVTGRHLPGTPDAIEERTDALVALVATLGEARPAASADPGMALKLRKDANPPAELFTALLENERKFKASWEHSRTDLADDSLSVYDQSLATLAAYAGWKDQAIADLLVAHRRSHGSTEDVKKALRPRRGQSPGYLEATITMARDTIARGGQDTDAVDETRVKSAIENGPDEALSELCRRVALPVEGVIQRGVDPAFYYVVVKGQEIRLGSSTDLLSPGAFRANVLGGTRMVVPRMKGPRWDRCVKLMLDVATLESLGEGDHGKETFAWVENYLSDQRSPPVLDTKALEIALKEGVPIWWRGCGYLAAKGLARWIYTAYNERVPLRILCSRLHEAGWHSHHLQVRNGKENIQAKLWRREISPEGWAAYSKVPL